MHRLMIKTHKHTGLKYLCYTRKNDWETYPGSGKHWRRHLLKHGAFFDTELIFESDDFDEWKLIAIEKSIEYDVVNSPLWANLKIEDGDGGDTVSGKKWITNGSMDAYHDTHQDLPVGWKYGRSECVFNDPVSQRSFSMTADSVHRGTRIKEAWDSGKFDSRDNSKCGIKGVMNPAKRSEVRKKIKETMLRRKHA